jgi:hypothetical protein
LRTSATLQTQSCARPLLRQFCTADCVTVAGGSEREPREIQFVCSSAPYSDPASVRIRTCAWLHLLCCMLITHTFLCNPPCTLWVHPAVALVFLAPWSSLRLGTIPAHPPQNQARGWLQGSRGAGPAEQRRTHGGGRSLLSSRVALACLVLPFLGCACACVCVRVCRGRSWC